MSPLFVAAEGRERYAPADRLARLRRIARLLDRVTDEPGGHLSKHFNKLLMLFRQADFLIDVFEAESPGCFADALIAEATLELWRWKGLLPYPNDGGES